MATIATSELADLLRTLAGQYREVKARLDERDLKDARHGLVSPGFDRSQEFNPETKAFLKMLRHGERRLDPSERKALVEDSNGQYLVPADVEQEIFRAASELGTIRPLASKRTTNRDRVQVRTLSGLSAGWGKLETGTDITEGTLTPTQDTVYIEDLYGLTKIGEDELADASDAELAQIVAQEFGKVVATMENAAFIKGAGHASSEPNGITTDTTLAAAAVETSAASAIAVEDILNCVYTVPNEYRKNLSIICHSQTELELRKLRSEVAAGYWGNFLWQPSVAAGKPATFCGWPIYVDDNLGTLSGTQEVLAIIGNISEGYRIFDRSGLQIQFLDQLYAEAGLVAWKLHYRVGSYVVRPADKRIVLLKEHS